MGFSKPKTPNYTPAKTEVEEVDEPAKRETLLNRRKKQTGASSTLLSPQADTFGSKQTLG